MKNASVTRPGAAKEPSNTICSGVLEPGSLTPGSWKLKAADFGCTKLVGRTPIAGLSVKIVRNRRRSDRHGQERPVVFELLRQRQHDGMALLCALA
jgi:hypothetical protein